MRLLKKTQKWILENKRETLIFFLIILLAAFLRLYKIDEYMTFLGDEGRDMLVMKHIWVDHDLPFIGPPTSVGNMYLGPLYYYMMAVPTLIFWMNPVAAAVMDALIGVATVGLIYYLSRIWFGKVSAIVSSLLYALSPVTIVYARSSWNPNPAPFFALLSIYGMFKAHRSGNMMWLIFSGAAFAFLINMHYLALIMLPVLGLLWLYELSLHFRQKIRRKNIWLGTVLAIITFLVLMSPLFLFEVKHNFPNYNALLTLFTAKDSAVGTSFADILMKIVPIYSENLIGRYISGPYLWLTIMVSLLVVLPLVYSLYFKIKGYALKWPILALGVWLLVGLLGLTLYKQEIYDHYLGFISPLPFILLGFWGSSIWENKRIRTASFVSYGIVILVIIGQMVYNLPLRSSPNKQLKRTQEIAREVLNDTKNRPYNFALIAKSNYDSAYQFYLEQYGQKPGQLPFEKTDQLFVVCEDEVCQPTTSPKYEIAAFGMSKVEWMKDFQGVKLYKLIANPSGEPQ